MIKKSLLVFALLLSAGLIHSQVTIGSGEKPNAGALLDLKTETDGSSKLGLGMPRVELSKLKPTTDAELAASIGATGSWSLTEHVGLLVYNAVGSADVCSPLPPVGLYVWDGTTWVGLGVAAGGGGTDHFAENIPDPTTGVGTVTDYEGNVYGTKRFKNATIDAGIWTTENLYSLVKADGVIATCPDGVRLNPGMYSTSGGAKAIRSLTDYTGNVTWGQDASTAPTSPDQSLPMQAYAKKFGLSYTWAQANTACPKGWRLPTDADWDKLADALGGASIAGAAMRANNDFYLANDNSTSYEWGQNDAPGTTLSGFNALPSGYVGTGGTYAINFSNIAYWWSAATSGSYRYLYYHGSYLNASTYDAGSYFSVRCVKN